MFRNPQKGRLFRVQVGRRDLRVMRGVRSTKDIGGALSCFEGVGRPAGCTVLDLLGGSGLAFGSN